MHGAGGFSGARDEGQGRWGREAPPPVAHAPSEALSGKSSSMSTLCSAQLVSTHCLM